MQAEQEAKAQIAAQEKAQAAASASGAGGMTTQVITALAMDAMQKGGGAMQQLAHQLGLSMQQLYGTGAVALALAQGRGGGGASVGIGDGLDEVDSMPGTGGDDSDGGGDLPPIPIDDTTVDITISMPSLTLTIDDGAGTSTVDLPGIMGGSGDTGSDTGGGIDWTQGLVGDGLDGAWGGDDGNVQYAAGDGNTLSSEASAMAQDEAELQSALAVYGDAEASYTQAESDYASLAEASASAEADYTSATSTYDDESSSGTVLSAPTAPSQLAANSYAAYGGDASTDGWSPGDDSYLQDGSVADEFAGLTPASESDFANSTDGSGMALLAPGTSTVPTLGTVNVSVDALTQNIVDYAASSSSGFIRNGGDRALDERGAGESGGTTLGQ